MDTISTLMKFIEQPKPLKDVLVAVVCWLILSGGCCVFGAVGLFNAGRRKGVEPYLPAFLPGGQTWYTIKLSGEERATLWAEHLIWWCPALSIAGTAATIWGAYYYVLESRTALVWLIIGGILLIGSIAAYVWTRVLEFKCLWGALERWQWIVSLIGTLILMPVQRIILFAERTYE